MYWWNSALRKTGCGKSDLCYPISRKVALVLASLREIGLNYACF